MPDESRVPEALPITLAEQFAEWWGLLFPVDPGKMLPDA